VAQPWWLTPVIPATQEAEIMRIMVQSQPRQIVHATLSPKTLHKNRAGGVALSSSPSTEKKKNHCSELVILNQAVHAILGNFRFNCYSTGHCHSLFSLLHFSANSNA
jgi:hypothetical protein